MLIRKAASNKATQNYVYPKKKKTADMDKEKVRCWKLRLDEKP